MFRRVSAVLWQFVVFRYAVLFACLHLPSRASQWLAINTPAHDALRALLLRNPS